MILVLLLLLAILCVELIHPMSLRIHQGDEYCEAAFATVWHCILMFFQTLVAGDSWGHCALPVIKEAWWTFLIFSAAVISVQLGFMNLILAVIVERAAEAKEEDQDTARREKAQIEEKATQRLGKLFAEIDSDGSGSISLDELLEGYDSNQQMQNMFGKLDITRNDLGMLFELMDSDNVGELSYDSLIQNLRTCQMENTRKSLAMLRLQTAELARCYKRSASLGPEMPRTIGSPQLSATSCESNCQSGTVCSIAEVGSSASTVALNGQSQPLVLVENLPLSETTNHILTQPIHNINHPHTLLIDMEAFDMEVAEFQTSLGKALAGIRDSVDKFGNSVPLAWEGSNGESFACEPCKEASGGLMQPAFDGNMLDTGIGLRKEGRVKDLPEVLRIPGVAILVSDSPMNCEQKRLQVGEVSL